MTCPKCGKTRAASRATSGPHRIAPDSVLGRWSTVDPPPKTPQNPPPRHNSITDFLPRVVFIVSITSGLQGPSAQLSPAIPGLGGPNAIVNRLEAEANHDHPDQRL